MIYSYEVKDDFRPGFDSLPSWLQEETLDELEALLLAPERLIRRAGNESAYYDFTRKRDGVVHYVFLTVDPDHVSRVLTFNGFTANEILSLPDDTFDTQIVSKTPMVVRVGSADVLCQFWVDRASLILELGHIDGGGEGVLPAIAVLARRYALRRGLKFLDWRVHAVNCKEPNLKLRRLLERRGFQISEVPETGVCYHVIQRLPA